MNKWISVDEKLPFCSKDVLVYISNYPRPYIDVTCTYRYGKDKNGNDTINWQDGWRKGQRHEITHWMPLPAPPNTESVLCKHKNIALVLRSDNKNVCADCGAIF